jgi:hypothetical protein
MSDIQNDKKICENDFNIRKQKMREIYLRLNPENKRMSAKYHQIMGGVDMADNACQK